MPFNCVVIKDQIKLCAEPWIDLEGIMNVVVASGIHTNNEVPTEKHDVTKEAKSHWV